MHRRILTFIVVALALVSLAASPAPQRSVTYERYDVDIRVQRDGSLLVAETYQLRFQGEFQTAFAEIPLDNVTDIVDVQVREGNRSYMEGGSGAGTFSLERGFRAIQVDWEYEPTSDTDTRTFTVAYRVLGALWVYPDGDWLAWKAVPAHRSGIPTEASRVTVHLPSPTSGPPVDPDALIANAKGIEATAEVMDAQTVVFESSGAIPDGTAFEVEVGFPHGLTDAQVTDWQRRADEAMTSYRWTNFDVDLTIAEDGALTVNETHSLAVDVGHLYSGYRAITWLYLDRITDITVRSTDGAFEYSQTPCEYCYVLDEKPGGDWARFDGEQLIIDRERAGSTLVEWTFPPINAGETGSFEVHYTVLGAVRVLSDTQEINWTTVFADRDAPVEAATLNMHLPPGVSANDVAVSGGTMTAQADGRISVKHEGPVSEGRAWSVTIQMPPDATTAKKPTWQGQLEQQLRKEQEQIKAEQEQAVRVARWQIGLGALGCLLPVIGLTGVLGAWYVWGHDRAASPVASYLAKPPSDLPPGIVAYLVDEKPTVKGVLADLLHLATFGLITVDLQKEDFTVQLNWTREIEEDELVRIADGEPVELAEHERTLFNVLLEQMGDTKANDSHENRQGGISPIPFSRIEHAFLAKLPTIYQQMGEAASRYFSVLPETARRRWRWAGQIVVIAAGVLGLVGVCGTTSLGWPACAPPVGLTMVGLMLMGISRWMPQRTTLGIEEAARWRAFRRYLKNLKQFGDLEAAQVVLDRYFPYAVALDVDEIVLRQAEMMEARLPIWTVPASVDIGPAAAQTERQRGLRDRVPKQLRLPQTVSTSPRVARVRPSLSERPASADISLQGLSDSLSRSLNRASRSLSSLLNTAVGDVDDVDAPFEVVVKGAGEATKMTWKAGTTTMRVLGDILEESSSGGGGGGFSGGGFRSSSWSSSGSNFGRGSSSRSSGGGGSRGFG